MVLVGGHLDRSSECNSIPTERLLEIAMLISNAWAGHGVVGTGSSGGGNALLIIIAVGITLGLLYRVQKKWRTRRARRNGDDEQGDQ